MTTIQQKIKSIQAIIDRDKDTDVDFWLHCGNGLIYNIVRTFSIEDWEVVKRDFPKWNHYDHSIFARAILLCDDILIIRSVDIHEIFFIEFGLLTDLGDAACLLDDIMYIPYVKNKNLDLLNKVKDKIEEVRAYRPIGFEKSRCDGALVWVNDEIAKLADI